MTFVSRKKNFPMNDKLKAVLSVIEYDWKPLSGSQAQKIGGYSAPAAGHKALTVLEKRGLIETRSFQWQQHRANQYRIKDPNRKTKKPHPLAIGVYDE